MILAFQGGLGAGKTCFIRGLARGMGVMDRITSPTYTIVNEYENRIPLYHIDAYRLRSAQDFAMIDSDQYLFGHGVCALEWSENVVSALPETCVKIKIEILENNARMIYIENWPNEEEIR